MQRHRPCRVDGFPIDVEPPARLFKRLDSKRVELPCDGYNGRLHQQHILHTSAYYSYAPNVPKQGGERAEKKKKKTKRRQQRQQQQIHGWVYVCVSGGGYERGDGRAREGERASERERESYCHSLRVSQQAR